MKQWQINPNTAIALNIVLGVLSALSAPTIHSLGFTADTSVILAWDGMVCLVLNGVLHGYSSSTPGPLAPPDPPAVKAATDLAAKTAGALALFALIVGLGALGSPSTARAANLRVAQNGGLGGAIIDSVTGNTPNTSGAPTPSLPLTGNPVRDIQNAVGVAANGTDANLTAIEKAITADTIADFTAAQAAYVALNDTTGAACNQAILSELVALQTAANAKGLPKVHVAFDFAIARTIVLAVQPGSPIYNSCSPVADQVKQSVLQLVTGTITGATTVLPALGL